jgi:tetratricopeptide (TPR) repeat protein
VAKRYTRKELRQPDEFVTFWQHAYGFLRESQRPIVIGLVIAAAVIGGVTAWTHHLQVDQAESSRLLSRAIHIYTAELVPDDEAAKKAQAEDEIPRFKTSEERRKAALSELDGLIAKHTGGGASREAELVRGGVLFDGGQYDEAIKSYGEFLAQTDTENRLRFLAREGRGYAYEAKHQLDQALDEFRKLEHESGDFYRDRAQYHEARILEKKGDRDGAQKLYKSILEKNPATALRDDISNRLAALESH